MIIKASVISILIGLAGIGDSMIAAPQIGINALVNETAIVEAIPEDTIILTDSEIDMIAQLTMAEAEGESEYGKRLVIDSVLNRLEHEAFPKTVHDVIWQVNQYSPMWNGRFNCCYVRDDIRQLVAEEAASRTNKEVIFFAAGNYNRYGEPLFPEGSHYFSKY